MTLREMSSEYRASAALLSAMLAGAGLGLLGF